MSFTALASVLTEASQHRLLDVEQAGDHEHELIGFLPKQAATTAESMNPLASGMEDKSTEL